MIDNTRTTSTFLTGIFLVSFLAAPCIAQADYSQDSRIKKMGFVSISDDSAIIEKDEPYSIEQFQQAESSEYAEVDEDFDQFEQIDANYTADEDLVSDSSEEFDNNDELAFDYDADQDRDYIEVSPIVVSPIGAKVGQNRTLGSTNRMVMQQQDDRIREAAAIILHSKPAPEHVHDTSTPVHRAEAINYYNFDLRKAHNREEFINPNISQSYHGHEDVQLVTDEPAGPDGYNYDYASMSPNEGHPTIDLEYSNKRKYMGLPLVDAKIQITGGYRVDDFDFNIAGDDDGNNPNVLSELTWTDLQMMEVKAKGEAVVADMIVVDFRAGYGWIVEGENQDSDYFGDNRTDEFSRSNNDTDDGSVWDLSFAGGLRFHIQEPHDVFYVDDLWVTLLGGYSSHKQKFEIKNGFQTIPEFGGFAGLDSRYNAEWNGPWFGFQLDGNDHSRKMHGYARFEYHFPEYEADATWNLRTSGPFAFAQPRSFEHTADDGWGVVLDMGGHYQINQLWSFALNLTWQDWHVEKGVHRVFPATGGSLTSRLNDVNWNSLSIGFGFSFRF